MKYIERTEPYNDRRYGKPWKAIITSSITKDFTFLVWEGRSGCTGEFSFDAEPGTLLAYGQKDMRKSRGGVEGYQICLSDGMLACITDETAIVLRKLPVTERLAECARRKIAACEEKIAKYAAETGEYYVMQRAELAEKIAKWKTYLPTTDIQTVNMSAFGF